MAGLFHVKESQSGHSRVYRVFSRIMRVCCSRSSERLRPGAASRQAPEIISEWRSGHTRAATVPHRTSLQSGPKQTTTRTGLIYEWIQSGKQVRPRFCQIGIREPIENTSESANPNAQFTAGPRGRKREDEYLYLSTTIGVAGVFNEYLSVFRNTVEQSLRSVPGRSSS